MSRTEKITDIIEKRRPLAEKIAAVQGNLESLLSAIGQLEAHRQRLINDTDVTDLDKLDFLSVQENIQQEHQQLEILEKRFSRPTLNIGLWTKRACSRKSFANKLFLSKVQSLNRSNQSE